MQETLESKEQTDLGKENFKTVFELYIKAYNYYNTSLDIIRKIMVYFPPQVSAEVRDVMAELTAMSPEKLELVKKYIETLSTDNE